MFLFAKCSVERVLPLNAETPLCQQDTLCLRSDVTTEHVRSFNGREKGRESEDDERPHDASRRSKYACTWSVG